MLQSIQERMTFVGVDQQARPHAIESFPHAEHWTRVIDEGEVEAWFIPGEDTQPSTPRPAVIFAHGNYELIEHWPSMLAFYRDWKVNLLLVEYRGYGQSAGRPTQLSVIDDFRHFYDQLAERPEVDRERIIFHGRSLGGGVIAALARERKAAALILQSTFTNIADMAKRFYLPAFLVSDHLNTEEFLRSYKNPILIVHGTEDRLVPFEHARRLHAAAPHAELVAYRADHNSCPPPGSDYVTRIHDFITPLL